MHKSFVVFLGVLEEIPLKYWIPDFYFWVFYKLLVWMLRFIRGALYSLECNYSLLADVENFYYWWYIFLFYVFCAFIAKSFVLSNLDVAGIDVFYFFKWFEYFVFLFCVGLS